MPTMAQQHIPFPVDRPHSGTCQSNRPPEIELVIKSKILFSPSNKEEQTLSRNRSLFAATFSADLTNTSKSMAVPTN